jgi:dTDP-4-dehydrorhamnose reductase
MIKKKVLVLGATSQIGQSLLKENNDLIELFQASRKDIDLMHLDLIQKFIIGVNPDIVINCAAFTNVDGAEDNVSSVMTINSASVEEIVKACNKISATLIHFSSDYVFDGNAKTPYLETSEANPLSVYGRSKLNADRLIETECSNFLLFRISWIYGIYNNNFLKAILNKIKIGEKLRVVDDQIGSPTTSRLVSQVILDIISNFDLKGKKELLNIQPKGSCSWFDFANFINDNLSNIKKLPTEDITPVSSGEFNAKALRPRYSVLDTNKIENAYGISFNTWQDYAIEEIKNLDRVT